MKIAVTVYLLSIGLFIPASTWISKRIGIKKTLLVAVVGFVFASICCGLSSSLVLLVAARTLQGLFGAFTMPVARLALLKVFKKIMLYAMGVVGSVLTLGPMIGPLLGGAITTYLNWRYIFFINVPVGLFCFVMFLRHLPKMKELGQLRPSFDWLGFIILGGSICLSMLFLDILLDKDVITLYKLLIVIAAIGLACLYFPYARRKKHGAILDLHIFQNSHFAQLVKVSVVMLLSTMGASFLFSLYLQAKQGYSPFHAGVTYLAFIISAWLSKSVMKILPKFFDFYPLLSAIVFIMFVSMGLCVMAFMEFHLWLYLLALFASGGVLMVLLLC